VTTINNLKSYIGRGGNVRSILNLDAIALKYARIERASKNIIIFARLY